MRRHRLRASRRSFARARFGAETSPYHRGLLRWRESWPLQRCTEGYCGRCAPVSHAAGRVRGAALPDAFPQGAAAAAYRQQVADGAPADERDLAGEMSRIGFSDMHRRCASSPPSRRLTAVPKDAYWVPDGRAAAGRAQAGGGACCAVCCRRVRENSGPGGEAHVAWHPSLWGWGRRWWNKTPALFSRSCSACQASPGCSQPARSC